jgi:very-short-patch-repair endonuclease
MYRDQDQRDFARHLRTNMTDAERRLWSVLRMKQIKGFKFRRQAAIGAYVADFVCFPAKLTIELDGGQHNEATTKGYDEERSTWLRSQGFRVLRFWNHDVFESLDAVAQVIWNALTEIEPTPPHPPSPTLPAEGRESEAALLAEGKRFKS